MIFNKDRTFALDDLDEEFWKKVLLIVIRHSSGLLGWGYLEIATSDSKMYFIGFEGFPYNERKLEEFAPIFKPAEGEDRIAGHYFEAENHGWTYSYCDGHALIRNDFYEAFMREYRAVKKNPWDYVFIPDVAGKALGTSLERWDYEVSRKLIEQERMKRENE